VRAVYYEAFGAEPTLRDLPDPVCPPDGVVVAVEATGLCRSDWHGWMGHDPDIRPPHVPGHEFAGRIATVGADVSGWREGDLVTAPFVCACGACPECLAGDEQVCRNQEQPGFTYWGSFAEAVVVPRAAVNLVRVPEGLDAVVAASLGCRFATAYRAVVAQGRLTSGESLAVHGCGGVGLSAIMIGASRGATVVAVDPSPDARRAALDLGAAHAIDPSDGDVPEAVRAVSDGGVHVSIDAIGSIDTCVGSVLSLRRRGRHVQVGLMVADQARPGIPMDRVVAHELELRGSHGMAARDYAAMLAEIASGTLQPGLLVGRTIGLDEAPAALMAMGGPAAAPGMTVIVPS
jgi:alcohol dehydrogenase